MTFNDRHEKTFDSGFPKTIFNFTYDKGKNIFILCSTGAPAEEYLKKIKIYAIKPIVGEKQFLRPTQVKTLDYSISKTNFSTI